MEGTIGSRQLCLHHLSLNEIVPENCINDTQQSFWMLSLLPPPVESGTRRSACHSTLRSKAKLSLTCLNTQITLQGKYLTITKTLDLSIINDIHQSETTTNRKVRSHFVRKLNINCHFMFLTVFGLFWVFYFFLFLFTSNLVFGFFLVIHHLWLVLRFLFNCFWSKSLGVSGLMTSHLTLLFSIFSQLFSGIFSRRLCFNCLFSLFLFKMAVPAFLRNGLVRIKNSNFKNSR